MEVFTYSPEETIELGAKLGKELPPNSVICFTGDLAAGKTTFIKGLVSGRIGCPPEEIISPTFIYLNVYEGKLPVYHFDLYRLHDVDEFLSMGFDEYFFSGGICCIEWVNRILPVIPESAIWIDMHHTDDGARKIEIRGLNEKNTL